MRTADHRGKVPAGYHRGVNTYWHVVLPPLCA